MTSRTVILLAALFTTSCFGDREREQPDAPPSAEPPGPADPALPVGDSGAPKLQLVDEADSSFTEFRKSALAALQQRDTIFLYAMLAPEIKNSFGGDDSIAGFRRIWKMERADSSHVWEALTRVFTLGGRMQGETFTAPYVYAAWPDDIDAFEHVAITDQDVPAYASPDVGSEKVARLSWSILPIEEWTGMEDGVPGANAFARVKLPDRRSVFVPASQAYSPVGWRAFFEKRDDRWVMTLFVAGD